MLLNVKINLKDKMNILNYFHKKKSICVYRKKLHLYIQNINGGNL